jgi:GAF domain-containing protein
LETAAQIAGEATVIQDVEELLEETVHLISSRFGFYHTGVFLLDESGRYALLRAASSEGGRRMLARGHRLRVGEVGLVGHAVDQGEPRIALDVGVDAAYFDNPDLPETRSEIALPLRARGEVIGALDVQSTEPEAFAEDDIAVLQTLADQVAIALSNARLFQQAAESLEAERQAYGELSREAWRRLLRTQAGLAQRYDPQGILSEAGDWRPEMKLAVDAAEAVPSDGGPTPALAIPIKVRGEVIGIVDAHKAAGSAAWTPEQVELLQTLVDQVGLALDSARLHQDAQQRATQEQVMGEVAARMRETLDLDTVLQTAIREIGQALGIPEVEVRMGASGEMGPGGTTAGGGNGRQGVEGGSP